MKKSKMENAMFRLCRLFLKLFPLLCLLPASQNAWSESMTPDSKNIVSISDTAFIPRAKLEKLKHDALQGDWKAAADVSMYYEFYEFNHNEGLYWLTKSAQAGNVRAQHDLAYIFFDEYRYGKTESRLADAEKWALQAKQNGMPVDGLLADIYKEKQMKNNAGKP